MKKEQEELTIWGKIELFFRDLFMMPSRDGKRRFVKNIFTGKSQWTSGESPLPTTVESLRPSNLTEPEPISNIKINPFEKFPCNPFEPLHQRRWVLEFPGIDSFVFVGLKTYSDEMVCAELLSIVNENFSKQIEEYYQNAGTSKGRLHKHAVLKFLGPDAKEIESFVYRNIKIEEVQMLQELAYDSDELLTIKIFFSHEKRKRVESPEDLAENIFEEEELLYEMNGEDMDKMDAYFLSEYMKETPQEVVAEFQTNEKTGEITGGLTTRKKRGPYKKRVPKDKKTTKKIVVKTKKSPLIKSKKKK